jgi:copper/silver efflux system protein
VIVALIRWSARHALLVVAATLIPCIAGLYALTRISVDAIPDLSDAQVIVYTEFAGQSAETVEDLVTYPLTTTLLSVPHARVVRGVSMPSVSFVYVIFADGTDLYWARARVQEQLSTVARRLPAAAVPTIGPNATGVGWVFHYVVHGPDGKGAQNLAELRSLQDWNIKTGLSSVPGVAEVASIGGFVKTYAITVDPIRLRARGVTLAQVRDAVRNSNQEVGGRTIELAEAEYAVQGRGYIKNLADIDAIVVRADAGVPVQLKDVARVEMAPDERRGVSELNGDGEAVSGIVVQRSDANTRAVIDGVKRRLLDLAPGLPPGTRIETIYDRSLLIDNALVTASWTLAEETVVVSLICLLFLWHLPSAFVTFFLIPAGILIAALVMHLFGISANIMSLGGMAIAIGAMVDAALVMIENAHKRMELVGREQDANDAVTEALVEVGPALFYSLLIITVSFLPILTLEAEEGRLFRPLAFTKTFVMAAAAILSVTLVPALMTLFVQRRSDQTLTHRGRIINSWMIAKYRPLIGAVLRHKLGVVLAAKILLAISIWPALRLGTEYMPPLNEGVLFAMPTTAPGLSIGAATQLLQNQDRIIKSFPEVAAVLGKSGRAMSATDPAPLEMFETIITLKPAAEWRPGMTQTKLIAELDAALQFPGVANYWTTPIRARIDMLSTGIRTPVGVKIFGNNLAELDRVAAAVEAAVKAVPGTTSAYAERVIGGRYVNIEPDRSALARYGLTVGDMHETIRTAIGGEAVTTTVEGRERYVVAIRYPRELRSDVQSLSREVQIALPNGKGTVSLGDVAKISIGQGASSIRSENAKPVAYVFVDFRGRDLGSFVAEARKAVAETVVLPVGTHLTWSGQFEHLQRAEARLKFVVPITLSVIFLLLYLNFRRWQEALIVMLTLPFALIGGVWLMWLLDYNLSVAGVVGFIALAGIAAETGVVMLIYIDQAYQHTLQPHCPSIDVDTAIMNGAADRVRPKLMTVCAIMAGLLPIMWSVGAGADIMQRIAVPMIGGMVSSTILTLIVIPAVYALAKGR